MRILVVDDESAARRTLVRLLTRADEVSLHEAASLTEARAALADQRFDVAFVDLRLGSSPDNCDGLTLVQELRAYQWTASVVVSGASDMISIRAAMRLGAYAYVLKDELRDELVSPILEELRRRRALEKEVTSLRARARGDFSELVGSSASMQQLRETMRLVALSDRPVLVSGPTGSGKELVVRGIHALGARPEQPLLDLNCGALPAPLIESQLFGHEKGAFTGADRAHDGFFTAVGEGTLFLDEIAELPLDLQAKLLRVLESKTFRPVGSTRVLRFRGRLVAATHADLAERVRLREFREDLYYRINVLEVSVPCLSDRREDIPALAAHFAARQPTPLRFTNDAVEYLRETSWPGNVRELRNLIDRIGVFAEQGVVSAEDVKRIRGARRAASNVLEELVQHVLELDCDDKLRLVEHTLVAEAMRRAGENKSVAARLLGVHRKVVERRVGPNPLTADISGE